MSKAMNADLFVRSLAQPKRRHGEQQPLIEDKKNAGPDSGFPRIEQNRARASRGDRGVQRRRQPVFQRWRRLGNRQEKRGDDLRSCSTWRLG
jgi:hypothetical protein